MNSPSPSRAAKFVWVFVAALLCLQYGLAVGSKRQHSTTSDELVHLTGGYTYWKFNDYRIHPENGNLPQRWAALPAWLGGARPPQLEDSIHWRASDSWLVGHDFFYLQRNDHERWLLAGRAMIALFATATGLLIFVWARRLWGTAGGFTALGFFCFCPTILAHGALVTSDICMTFFFLAAVGAYWRHLHDDSLTAWGLSAFLLGLASVAKFSAVLLLPMVVLMVGTRLLRREPIRFGRLEFTRPVAQLGAMAASTVLQGLVAGGIIWLFFGLRYSAFNPAVPPANHFIRPWEIVLPKLGLQGELITALRSVHLLPEGYLYGYAYTLESVISRSAFLDGEYSIYGWVSFFPKTFLYKTPLALLVAIVFVAILVGFRLRSLVAPRRTALAAHLYPLTPLLTLLGVYWLFSLTSNLNIGHRHILPTYPVLFILVGVLAPCARRAWQHNRASGIAIMSLTGALVGWMATDALRTWPHYLAYFNSLIGGPATGYKHLVDSSLDWGQDLPGLKRWLDTNRAPGEPLYLSYFGTSLPSYYGIDAVALPTINSFNKLRPWYWPEPGIYAISATMLQQVYLPYRDGWTVDNEEQYQAFRQLQPQFRLLKAEPYGHPELFKQAPPGEWAERWRTFELLRFARLCRYLRVRQPDAMIGYSILVFRLDQTELSAALEGSIRDLGAAIERAAAAP